MAHTRKGSRVVESASSSENDESESSPSEQEKTAKKKSKQNQNPKKKAKATTDKKTTGKRKRKTKKKGPPRAKTPYIFWMQKNRAEFKKKNPELAFGPLSKKMGEEWKKLDEAGKKEYEDLANADKERFRNDLKTFKPPPSSSSESSDSEPPKKKRKAKKKKDPNAPKRALNAFMYFSKDIRPQVVKDNPELQKKVHDVSRIIGDKWKKMSDEEKKPYVAKSDADKQRYAKDIELYNKTGKVDGAKEKSDEPAKKLNTLK